MILYIAKAVKYDIFPEKKGGHLKMWSSSKKLHATTMIATTPTISISDQPNGLPGTVAHRSRLESYSDAVSTIVALQLYKDLFWGAMSSMALSM